MTLPKLALEGVMVNAGCTPLPVTGITALAPWELAIVIFPATFSEAVGANDTLMAPLCPAVKVTGVVIPLTCTSFALILIWEIVRSVLPPFVIVTIFELEFPAFTLPNVKLVGFAESVMDAASPLPLNARTFGELGALLAILTDPPRLPAVVGANTTLNVVLPPAATVVGVVNPLTL